ncbi:MAG: 4-alpha-glucanotransferase [Candidatus Gastranaerophilales bacterium]|nr:4-alpha-glucanotransferase [Candidatus Gastranaerophilales bacterium]
MSQKSLTNLTKINKKEFMQTIQTALSILGKNNLTMIMHGSSFPSLDEGNTGFGSPNSNAARLFIDYISGIFNSIQLGPAGKTKGVDSSPYTGTAFSNNTLFIDISELTSNKWSNILSTATFENIVLNNPNKDINKTAYSYIFQHQEIALKEAFENFKRKLELKDKNAIKINMNFKNFVNNNIEWLETDSLYEALSVKHNNDYWPLWNDESDKNLLNQKDEHGKKEACQRIEKIKKEFADVIEYYNFCQFIANEQKEDVLKYAQEKNVKMIADRQVAFSDRDFWANQAFFLEGWYLGCPPDYFSKDGQAWGFPVMDPEKLFNVNGSLGEGGKVLKLIFKKMFRENPGGVRIDHIVGLIDPWVYKKGTKPKAEEGAGRLYSSPEHSELSKYAAASIENIDFEYDPDSEFRIKNLNNEQIQKYGSLIEKIVIAAAKEEGCDKQNIICEDLGTLTNPVEKVMDAFDLSGMRVTQFVLPEKPKHPYRGVNVDSKQWIMTGTHDNQPVLLWAQSIDKDEARAHAQILALDLIPGENAQYRETYTQNLVNYREELAKAKFVELFASPAENIQIFFSDFFGIKDVYNKPGTSGDQNWSLRLPNNFEEFYIEQVKNNKALNLPDVLKRAIETKGQNFANKNADLIEKLESLSKQLID